jgi:UDP-N-acetylmuramoyl-tripeptide--D-alanyl-D-alanine ligase
MFQLNGYKNNEQITWVKKNILTQISLCVFVLLSVLVFLLNNLITIVSTIVFTIIEVLFYISQKKKKTKKALVYTRRVQRLLATNFMLIFLASIVLSVFCGWKIIVPLLCVVAFVEPILIILSNILNTPIERAINRYFINDAKKMLRESGIIKVIGITGSYGKTSVKYYLQTLLNTRYNVLITPESYNTPMGVVKTIRSSLKSTHEVFLCEMGARYIGDIKEICDIVHPDWGVITAIGPQHLETFGNIENIVNTKFELGDAVSENGKLILNGDNEFIRNRGLNYKNTTYYNTRERKGGYYTKNITLSPTGTKFTVVTPNGEEEQFHTYLVGEHNIINILGSIAVANMLGIKLKDLIIPVRRLQPVNHRMQMLRNGNTTIIDDAYNSNPIGSKAAVTTLGMFDGLKILVTPGMVELGDEEYNYNYKFGEYAAKCCDFIILVGKQHTKPILEGMLNKGFPNDKYKIFESVEEAVTFAYSIPTEKHKFILLENDLPDNY